MINKIKDIFTDKIYNSAILKKTLNQHPEIKQYCQQILNMTPQYQKLSYIIISIIKNIQLNKCQYCGKTLTYIDTLHNHKYCSKKCKWSDPNWKNKCKQKKNTEQSKIKRTQTCLQKYGVENVSQLSIIKDKKKNTTNNHFGVDYPMQNKNIFNKGKKTLLNKYGVEHISQVLSIKDQKKFKKAILNFKNLSKYSDYVLPNFTFEQYLKDGLNNQSWICVKCGKPFIQKYVYTTGHIDNLQCCPRCLTCYPYISGYSFKEKQVVEFIKNIYNGKVIENDKQLISPLELDIVIPDKKLAIEFNRRLLA